MEKFEQYSKQNDPETPAEHQTAHTIDPVELHQIIEQTANYEGNNGLLLFQRLENPVVRKQLLDHYENAYQSYETKGHTLRQWKVDEGGEYVLEEDGGHVIEEIPYKAPTRAEIETMLDTWIEEEKVSTEVDYDYTKAEYADTPPSTSRLHLGWKNPRADHETTAKEWSIIEAHEKGHGIRMYGKSEIRDYFEDLYGDVLDTDAITFTEETYEREKSLWSDGATYEQAKQEMLAYLSDPMEIAERMSQLKNYFGMQGDEPFTKAHLDHAREHYTKDAFDNGMTEFFQAITTETEQRFLEVMNSAGI